MADKIIDANIDVLGSVKASSVPNLTGTLVTWEAGTRTFGTRTNAQIISDLGLNTSLDNKANIDGSNITAITSWQNTLGITSLINTLPNKANVNGNNLTNITDWRTNLGVYSTTQVDVFLAGKANTDATNLTNIPNWQSVLGITAALNINLQQVTNNGNYTSNSIRLGGAIATLNFEPNQSGAKNFQFVAGYVSADSISLRNITDNSYLMHFDANGNIGIGQTNVPYKLNVNGTIGTASHGTSLDWFNKLGAGANISLLNNDVGYIIGSNTSSVPSNFNFAIGYNGTQNFVQSHNGSTLALNPEGNNVTIQGENISASLIQLWNSYSSQFGNYLKTDGTIPMLGELRLADNLGARLNAEWAVKYDSNLSGINFVKYGVDDGYIFVKNSNGFIGLLNTNPQARLHVNGNVIVNDAIANNHAVTLGQINGQLANYALANGSNITNIPVWQSALSIPTNNNQLANGAGYITAASLPTVGDGQLSFTAPTGLVITGTFNANQSNNTNIPITYDSGYQGFTTAESVKLGNLNNITINGVPYSLQNNPNITVTATVPQRTTVDIHAFGGGNIPLTARKTRIVITDNLNYDIKKGIEDGDELFISSCGITGDLAINIDWRDKCRNNLNSLTYTAGQDRYLWWSAVNDMWLDVTT